MLPCSQECSWVLISADCDAASSSWVLLIGHDCQWALKSALDRSLVLMNAHEQPWTRICMVPWTLMSTDERSWALLSAHRQSWPIKRTHEDGAASQSALMSTQEHSWQHGNIILTAPECPQVIMSAHECYSLLMNANCCSIVLMTDQVLDST